MHDRDGELYLGDIPLSIATSSMSDVSAIRADMVRADVGVRVLSAPPFAFPLESGSEADCLRRRLQCGADGRGGRRRRRAARAGDGHARRSDVGDHPIGGVGADRGHGGGGDPAAGQRPVARRAALHHVLTEAARLDLAVLAHPMQLPRPEWSEYYLTNLIGNPVESTTAVASLILSGIKDALPGLADLLRARRRLCTRASRPLDTRLDDAGRCPARDHSATGGSLRRTLLRHRHPRLPQLKLLCELAGADKVVCGSDYPFDMAESDPARFAVDHGPGRAGLIRSGARVPRPRRRSDGASVHAVDVARGHVRPPGLDVADDAVRRRVRGRRRGVADGLASAAPGVAGGRGGRPGDGRGHRGRPDRPQQRVRPRPVE